MAQAMGMGRVHRRRILWENSLPQAVQVRFGVHVQMSSAEVPLKHIHVFRHTFATYALAKGIPALEVARILGHSTATTTLSMYGHAMPGFNRRLVAKGKDRKARITKAAKG